VPPPRRRPATPPPRRPKVAGLNRPAAPHQEPEVEDTPDLDVPVIGGVVSPGKPRPTPKRRDAGTPVDDPEPARAGRVRDPEPAADEDEDTFSGTLDPEQAEETEPAESVEEPAEEDQRQPKFLLPLVFVVVALLLGGLAWFFALKASDARIGSGNAALVDVNGTKDVVGAAQQAVTGVLSYKYDDMAKAKERAQLYLSGEAVDQYAKSMDALAGQIQQQKLQVTVNPVSVGVVRLQGDDARVLVFADQIGVRGDQQNQPSGGPTQFAMDMHRAGGTWKIVKLDFFDGR
jgi:Mce-associated membrane protein